MNRLAAVFLSLGMLLTAEETPYPEHGRVIGARAGQVTEVVPTYTDPLGKVRRGHTVSKEAQIYRVETGTRIYEFREVSKKPNYAFGDEVDFRVNAEHAFLKNKKKERKVEITAMEQKKTN